VPFVGDEAEKQALLLGEPGVFFTTPGYDGLPLVMLRLAEVKVERLRELVTDAWRMRAPDTLVSDLDEAGSRPTLIRAEGPARHRTRCSAQQRTRSPACACATSGMSG
jgi:hypothetical protein